MHRSLRSSSLTHAVPKEQGRNTPAIIVPAIVGSLGGTVGLDPCSNRTAVVPARARVFLRKNRPRRLGPSDVVGDGTQIDWLELRRRGRLRVFCNPPWDDLAVWIPLLATYAARGVEIVALLPLRPHRRYWDPIWGADAVCFLEALQFEGFDNKIPTPCVMVYWGPRVNRFRKHFTPWGHVLTRGIGGLTLASMVAQDQIPQPNLAAMRLLGAVLPHVSDDALKEAVEEALGPMSFGDALGLALDIQSHHGPEVSVRLQEVVESFALVDGVKYESSRAATKKTASKQPKKAKGKRKAPTNAPKKRRKKKAAAKTPRTNGKAHKPTADELDALIEKHYLRNNKEPIRTAEVATTLGVSKATALRSLKRLVAEKKARLKGIGRGAQFHSAIA